MTEHVAGLARHGFDSMPGENGSLGGARRRLSEAALREEETTERRAEFRQFRAPRLIGAKPLRLSGREHSWRRNALQYFVSHRDRFESGK